MPPQHHTMHKGGGTEVAQNGCRGDSGEHWTRFQGIWPPIQLSDIVQVPCLNYYGLGNDYPVVVRNLKNAHKKWAWLKIILGQEG